MDNALNALLSWQFLLFSLGIFASTWFVRTVVEYFIPNVDGKKLWEKLILPSMPLIFGCVVALFATKYPYPDGLISTSARLMFGGVAGMFSGLVYQVIKGLLKDKIQSVIPNPFNPYPNPNPFNPYPNPNPFNPNPTIVSNTTIVSGQNANQNQNITPGDDINNKQPTNGG